MDDRELNLKMAEVCRITTEGLHGPRIDQYPLVAEEYTHLAFYESLESVQRRQIIIWDPVHNWNQVVEYVVPALKAADFEWAISDHPSPGHQWKVKIQGFIENEDRTKYWNCAAVRECADRSTTARAFCEAALDVWKQARAIHKAWQELPQEKS